MAASRTLAHSIALFKMALALDLLRMVVRAGDFPSSPVSPLGAAFIAIACTFPIPAPGFLPPPRTDGRRGEGVHWVCLSTATMALEFSANLSRDAAGEAYSDRSGESRYSVDSEFRDEDLFMTVL